MAETITKEVVTEVKADEVRQDIRCNGDRVAVDGNYGSEGHSADAESFFAALNSIVSYEDISNVDVGGFSIVPTGVTSVDEGSIEVRVKYSSGARLCYADTLTDLEELAREEDLL